MFVDNFITALQLVIIFFIFFTFILTFVYFGNYWLNNTFEFLLQFLDFFNASALEQNDLIKTWLN